jgi:hypothetical protein
MTSTVTTTEYGTYQHGTPWFSHDRSWFRTDLWTCKRDGSEERERLFAAGPDDDTPVYRGPYNPDCSCCWLNFGHTTAAHEKRT